MTAVLPSREAQAQERQRQLVRIASDLIEESGLDAVTLPRVTERAGCARTLVYRYFASREELLAGVLQDYVERLDVRMPAAELRAALAGAVRSAQRGDDAPVRELVAVFWDVQIAAGLGGAILRTALRVNPQVDALIARSRRTTERRITDGLRAAGLEAFEAQVALDAMIASFVGLALRWKAGEIGRAKAIDVHTRVTVGLLRQLLTTGSTTRARPAHRRRAAASTGARRRSVGPRGGVP
ncbi:TetR/AcrR family transcriptional regulator [Candidatus Binatia bacterium]|nr:TetR/AcrR family transcriptional regulator [Candidatus Binatia bacterium]